MEKSTQTDYYNSKVDWLVYAIVLFTVACCFFGPVLTDEDYWLGFVLSVIFVAIEIFMFASVKYAIRGDELGIRTLSYKWEWFPIDGISEVAKVTGCLSSAALSVKRVRIKFSDPKILKSHMPLEISPDRRDHFIGRLIAINPNIMKVKR